MTWTATARAAIAAVHENLAPDVSLDTRVKAIDAAYPFGAREHFPYKAWLKARAAYLGQFGYQKRSDRQARLPGLETGR